MRKKHPAPLPRASIRRAFTLIELLVVIAIIAILAAILFPVFAQAKNAAKGAVDMSNIKQLSLASELWKADHEGYLVKGYSNFESGGQLTGLTYPFWGWDNALQPYTKNKDLFKSPLDPGLKLRGQGGDSDQASDHEYSCDGYDPATMYCNKFGDLGPLGARYTADDIAGSYRLNASNQSGYSTVTDGATISFRTAANESQIELPAQAFIIVPGGFGPDRNEAPEHEVTTGDTGYVKANVCIDKFDVVDFDRSSRVGTNPSKSARNGGRANYGFGDGHAKNMAWNQTWKALGPAVKDRNGNDVVPTMWRQNFTGPADACKIQENDPR